MHVFFDTEFTGLTSDPRLLSIGLLADKGSPRFQCNNWRYANPALARGWSG
jgi:hypothetical protein